MNHKNLFLFLVLLATTLSACDDLLRKDIDPDPADFPPKLSVSAILDSDSGRFALSICESRSMASFKDWRPVRETIIKKGEIRLFEDNNLILTIPGPFDLSFRKGHGDGRTFDGFEYAVAGISAKAGSTYRLEIDIEGFGPVEAETVMPQAPVCGKAEPDTAHLMTKTKIWSSYFQQDFGNSEFYPVKFLLTDQPGQDDYYDLNLYMYSQKESDEAYDTRPYGSGDISMPGFYTLGVTDFSLVRDNPDYLANIDALTEELYDIYMFYDLMLSDKTFKNNQINLELYLDARTYLPRYLSSHPRPDYNPETDEGEAKFHIKFDLLVAHMSPETFKHHKEKTLQEKGVDFLTEPINVTGNMKNAYGHFSAINTKRMTILEYEIYYYPKYDWSKLL